MKKKLRTLAMCLTIGVLLHATHVTANHQSKDYSREAVSIESLTEKIEIETVSKKNEPITSEIHIDNVVTGELVRTVEEPKMSENDIRLIALITMAEAEGESEEGKRLVIDTILNRVDSELSYFPDTVSEVIFQKNAFSSTTDGRMEKCYVMEDICELVKEELENRTNNDVLYFRTGHYSNYGTPMFAEGNHYFSSI